jgi:DNA-binding transcriptional MerR regulator/effector-binding domain-containing protein
VAKPSELIAISEFARRSRLTVKQLRSYDELGLLAPAYVDPDSGYRYYHRGQARTAITIALLRSLDVPLRDIHALLVAEPDDVAEQLTLQRVRIEAEVERGVRTLRSLERLLRGAELLPYRVQEQEQASVTLAGLGGRCPVGALDREVAAAVEELADLADGTDFSTTPVIGRYPLDLEDEVPFFVGIGSDLVAADGLQVLSIPASRVAATTHVGAHDELRLAYYPLLAHVEERGHVPAPFLFEVYLEAPPAVAADRARTEVLLPFSDRPTEQLRTQGDP